MAKYGLQFHPAHSICNLISVFYTSDVLKWAESMQQFAAVAIVFVAGYQWVTEHVGPPWAEALDRSNAQPVICSRTFGSSHE